MTEYFRKTFQSRFLRGIFLVLALIAASAGVGWFFGKIWLDRTRDSSDPKAVFAAGDETAPASESQQEWRQRAKIRARRSELKIDSQFFRDLVDEIVAIRYRDLEKNSSEKRAKRSEISLETLDRLANLDEMTRQEFGKFDRQQRREWRERMNEMRLGSRVLDTLADNAFFTAFPEITERPTLDRPLGQVRAALALSQLQSLRSGESYRKITALAEGGTETVEGSLSSYRGRAMAIEARSGQTLTLNLEADGEVSLYLYSPSGSVALLENSSDRQWSGKLPEDGFYELVIVSKSPTPIPFRLSLQTAGS
jgi:serine/threonine-protein kinase